MPREGASDLSWAPNALTGSRFVFAAALFGGAVWLSTPAMDPDTAPVWFGFTAMALFVIGALTDLFDGMVARALNAESELGARLDPMADKAMSFGALCFVAAANNYAPIIVAAAASIILRDWWVDQLRGRSPQAPGLKVTYLAKVKTALLFVALGFLFTGLPPWPDFFGRISGGVWRYSVGGYLPGVALLALAAFLAALTGWRYVRAARVTSGGA